MSGQITYTVEDIAELMRSAKSSGQPYVFFTGANINLHNLIVEPAIVHLHGQSHGFTQLNSADETDIHAKNLSDFIRTTLNHSPSLFIGYSGSADAFFTQVENKFDGEQRLIWIDYEKSANEHVRKFLDENQGTSHHIGNQDADEFLIALAKKLGCFPPKLFQNPYEHLLYELKDVIEFPMQANANLDILKVARMRLETDSKTILEDLKPNLQLLLLEDKYDEVVEHVSDIDLSEDDKYYIAWAYIMQGIVLSDSAKLTGDKILYNESIGKYQKAIAIKPDMYEAWNNLGTSMLDLAKLTDDKELMKDSIEKFAKASTIEPNIHDTWNNFGSAISTLAKLTSDKVLFEESIDKYKKAIAIKPDMYEAWNNFGNALQALAKLSENEELFKESFDKYEKAITINPNKHDAWNNWSSALLHCAELTKNETYIEEAIEKSKKAEEINPDQVYNLACGMARKNDTEGCRYKLFHAKTAGTLPSVEHLKLDKDLDNVRHLPWFLELVGA